MPFPTTLDDLHSAIPTGGSTDHEEHTLAVATDVEAIGAKIGTGSSTPTQAGYVLTVVGVGETAWSAPVSLIGMEGGLGAPGDSVTIAGGPGDDGADPGASIVVGGGSGAGQAGVITITGNMVGTTGNAVSFTGGNDGTADGGRLFVEPGEAGTAGRAIVYGGGGGAGAAGADATIAGGFGDDGHDEGASLTVGGGSGTGDPGVITVSGSEFVFTGLGNQVISATTDGNVALISASGNAYIQLNDGTTEFAMGGAVVREDGGVTLSMRAGSVDPSAGGGLTANVGSLYQRNDGAGVGELWVKTGAADTAWTKVV